MSSILSINNLLEALLLGSAGDGFFRLFYRLVPCCPARISWSRRRSRPTSKGGAQCPVQQSIRSRDSASRRHCVSLSLEMAGPTAIEHGPAFSGDMEVETGAVPSRTVMHDPRTKRPVRWVVPSSDSVVDDPKGILGGIIFALAASDGTPSIQSCSSATPDQAASISLYRWVGTALVPRRVRNRRGCQRKSRGAPGRAGCFAVGDDIRRLLFNLETGIAPPERQAELGTLQDLSSTRGVG